MTHEFVEVLPDDLSENVIYISINFAISAHKCACGCGKEVITPISPTDWKFTFDGESISLYPSIGNWNFPCRSHYWIKNNKIQWADDWSEEEIQLGRTRDKKHKKAHYEAKQKATDSELVRNTDVSKTAPTKHKSKVWAWIRKWLGG